MFHSIDPADPKWKIQHGVFHWLQTALLPTGLTYAYVCDSCCGIIPCWGIEKGRGWRYPACVL